MITIYSVIKKGFYTGIDIKTDLDNWEIGDKFDGWIGERRVAGIIIALPVILPDDIDDSSKIKLVLSETSNISNAFLNFGYKINHYQSAIDNGVPFKTGNTQIQIMPELNDSALGFIIGFRYLSKYNALYASDSSTSDTTYVYKFNPEDLSDYRRVNIAKSGFAYSCQLSYSNHKDRLYAVLGDNFSGQTSIEVIEIHPKSLEITNVISYPIENPTTYALGQPQSVIINEFLFIGAGYQDPRIYKFDLNTYQFVAENIVSSTNNTFFSMTTDGKKVYLFSSFLNTTQYITRIDPKTLTEEQTGSYTFPDSVSGGFTDDSIEIGDYLYVPIHLATVGFNKILKILKSDLTQNVVLDLAGTEITESLYVIQFDGNLIWYAGLNKLLGSYNPKTGENILYENPMPHNINEIISDGQRLFVSGFDTYPVADTGYVGRFLFPDKILERHYIDTVTGKRKVSFNSDGTIELPGVTNELIDNSSGNSLVIKKWIEANTVMLLGGKINFNTLPNYENDIDAEAGDLVSGDAYKTSTGEIRYKL